MLHRPGHDRDRAVRHLRHQPRREVPATSACPAGRRAQARAERRQDRDPLQGPERHAGLLARSPSRPPRRSTRKASSAPATPSASIDPADPHQGLKFDGRIAEDFKLATGTFVCVGPLRAQDHRRRRALRAGRGDHRPQPRRGRRADLPDARRVPQARAGLPADAPLKRRAGERRRCATSSRRRSTTLADAATGSANRVARAASCCTSRRRSTRAKSPTRARSTSAPCSSTAPRWSRRLRDDRAIASRVIAHRKEERHEHPRTSRARHRRRLRPGRSHRARARRGWARRSPCSTSTSTPREKVAAEIGGIACRCDITDADSVAAALAKARRAARRRPAS